MMSRILWIGPLLFLGGCVHWPERPVMEASSAAPRINKCGGDCLELKTDSGTDRAAFLRKLEELLSAQRRASAESMIARHLDDAIEILRQHDFKRPPAETHAALARVVDARLGHPADDGWTARLQGKGRGGLEQAEETLVKAQEYARKHEWKSARDLLQKNQAALAPYPYHAVQCGLTLTEAQRRLGLSDAAAQSWQQAVLMASRHLARWPAPALWEQLAAQRSVSTAWPAPVATAFASRLPAPLQDASKDPRFAAEALVWLHIGNARLERAEAALALPAFKHADSHGAFPSWDEFLSLHQAKALLAMHQTPAATTLLTALTSRADCPWRLPALALLGSGKLQEGHTHQAHAFLKEAVETSNADFACRADAEANLGLTLLATGDQPNGLRWLHNAQQRFETTHDRAGLRQCLENEANYLAQFNKMDDASKVRQKMRELESQQAP